MRAKGRNRSKIQNAKIFTKDRFFWAKFFVGVFLNPIFFFTNIYMVHKPICSFRGSQTLVKRLPAHEWTEDYIIKNKKTVQGALESTMLCLKPYNEVVINSASR